MRGDDREVRAAMTEKPAPMTEKPAALSWGAVTARWMAHADRRPGNRRRARVKDRLRSPLTHGCRRHRQPI
jgi:hypothetical protein